ncbi:precorrin-2 dehydrogenase [Flavobacteriaceae bacterium UJ101]|nr:precorrin-2 dehydrogenase [Flavobacteriaceae bacterium UJ101]
MNELYPIFLKVHQLHVLIVGGGFVGHEKLFFLLKSSPNAQVTVVAKEFGKDLLELVEGKKTIQLIQDTYHPDYLKNKQLVIGATNFEEINHQIYHDAKKQNILVNIADTPDYCDFYLGGIVTKGNVKLAISTNGKSPTMAKRLRQFFEDVIPEDINELAENLNHYRKTLRDDFEHKVQELNKITKQLIN